MTRVGDAVFVIASRGVWVTATTSPSDAVTVWFGAAPYEPAAGADLPSAAPGVGGTLVAVADDRLVTVTGEDYGRREDPNHRFTRAWLEKFEGFDYGTMTVWF